MRIYNNQTRIQPNFGITINVHTLAAEKLSSRKLKQIKDIREMFKNINGQVDICYHNDEKLFYTFLNDDPYHPQGKPWYLGFKNWIIKCCKQAEASYKPDPYKEAVDQLRKRVATEIEKERTH